MKWLSLHLSVALKSKIAMEYLALYLESLDWMFFQSCLPMKFSTLTDFLSKEIWMWYNICLHMAVSSQG